MKAKLMVVDDEQDVREMIRNHFTLRGYEVLTAKDGEEGVRVAEAGRPQIVMMDIKMPKLDGDQMLERLHILLPNSRFIVFTAYQNERIRERITNAGGCDAYFEKPVSIIELQRKVEELLQ